MGVANRDIKLENVLLGGDKKSPVIKLTDFGFSKSELDSVPTTICGTPGYMGVCSCTMTFPVILFKSLTNHKGYVGIPCIFIAGRGHEQSRHQVYSLRILQERA